MIFLKPNSLLVSLPVRVGKITDEMVYFGGEHFEWIQARYTPILRDDLIGIFGIDRPMVWRGRQIVLFNADGNLRARLPESKVQDETI